MGKKNQRKPAQKVTSWVPSPRQSAVLEAALEPGLRRTIVAICQRAQVTRRQFYRWFKDDAEFRAAWEGLWEAAIRRHLPGVAASMLYKGHRGSVPAARLVAEMAGILKHRLEHTGEGGAPLRIILTE